MLDADAILGLQRTVGNGAVTSLLEEERSPVHDVIKLGWASAGARRARPTWRRGSATTSPTYGCTTTRRRQHRRLRSTRTPTPSAPTSSSNATSTTRRLSEGQTTLAHELTHVVQQRSGPVDGTSAPGGIKVSDPSDRFEREAAANAERVMSAPGPGADCSCVGHGTFGAAPCDRGGAGVQGLFVQRQETRKRSRSKVLFVQRAEGEEEEEPVQGLFVQRAEGEEEEETPA